eukprot:3748170-Rhodomonas_salina.2
MCRKFTTNTRPANVQEKNAKLQISWRERCSCRSIPILMKTHIFGEFHHSHSISFHPVFGAAGDGRRCLDYSCGQVGHGQDVRPHGASSRQRKSLDQDKTKVPLEHGGEKSRLAQHEAATWAENSQRIEGDSQDWAPTMSALLEQRAE